MTSSTVPRPQRSPTRATPRHRPVAGAGGLSIGLEEANFAVVSAVEWLEDACQTFANRHPDAEVYQGDIAKLSFRRLRGDVAVVAGRPP